MEKPDGQFATLDALSAMLRLPRSWLRDQADAGTIPSLMVGHRRLFDPVAVRAALSDQTHRAVPAEFLAAEEVERTLRLPHGVVSQAADAGELASVQMSGVRRFLRADIVGWLRRSRVEVTADAETSAAPIADPAPPEGEARP